MLLNEEDYKILMKAEDITHTDYGTVELKDGEYLIPKDNLMGLIEDLIDGYMLLKEEDNE
ncbi:MAG: hypothetical protein J6S67_10615 [Methanobrevibacter sp.]|nr:hypothetical protein [Methanobrevibacter sp.]